MAGNHVQLSRRLKAIADMVTEGNRLVDVGCDHGYLPVYLMLNHKIPGAIATDVGKGPLARAQEHIAQYGMSKYIEARLCDGLQDVRTGEETTPKSISPLCSSFSALGVVTLCSSSRTPG